MTGPPLSEGLDRPLLTVDEIALNKTKTERPRHLTVVQYNSSCPCVVQQINKPPENADIYNEPPWITTDDGHVALTAYFRNPKKICARKGKKCNKPVHNKRPIGNLLWIQMSDFRLNKKVMKLPLKEKKIVDTPWVEGTCVPAMGNSFVDNKLLPEAYSFNRGFLT